MAFRFLQRSTTVAAPAQQREHIRFDLDATRSIEILRVRDPRARRIKLSVSERGIRLTLPQRASLLAGERFLHEHRDWLAAQLAQLDAFDTEPLQREITTLLPLRGEKQPLRWAAGRFTALQQQEDGLLFQTTSRAGDNALRQALRDFYEAQARADIGRWLPLYLPTLPRAPRRVQFKMMSSQWGSLAPDGTVALDLSLVLAPPAAFEYVLVHELCHLIHHDHSPAYWRQVEARCPQWREYRGYFREDGRRLKSQLRALMG